MSHHVLLSQHRDFHRPVTRPLTRTVTRAGALALVTLALTLMSGGVAQAHVQVIPDQTAAGSESTKLTFRVPTESEKASTVEVRVSLPTDTPLAEVMAEPLPGWTITITQGKLPKPFVLDGTTLTEAPSTVTWRAAKGGGVPPGQFQEFVLSAGPIPDNAKELSFPTVQTYSDGTVVTWNQPQAAGADEPEHPLPQFSVTAAPPDTAAGSTAAAGPAATENPAGPADSQRAGSGGSGGAGGSSDWPARALGGAGLVAGLLGLALGGLAWRRESKRAGGIARPEAGGITAEGVGR